MLNALGETVLETKKIGSQQEEIDLSKFPNGIYMVLLHVNGQVLNRKVIKK